MTKKDKMFNELANYQTADIKQWVEEIDKLLMEGGCKSAVDAKGNFTYTSKKSGKIICRITMNENGCTVRPNTNITNCSSMIAAKPTDNMLDVMRNTPRGCGGCALKNPNFVSCKHGGPYRFAHNGEQFESCRYNGYDFTTDDNANREYIKQWVVHELA